MFFKELGLDSMPSTTKTEQPDRPLALFRLSDSTGKLEFEAITHVAQSSLSTADAFLLDDCASKTSPAVYVWIGKQASLAERRLAVQYAQAYLYREQQTSRAHVAMSIVKMNEGRETDAFLHAFGE